MTGSHLTFDILVDQVLYLAGSHLLFHKRLDLLVGQVGELQIFCLAATSTATRSFSGEASVTFFHLLPGSDLHHSRKLYWSAVLLI